MPDSATLCFCDRAGNPVPAGGLYLCAVRKDETAVLIRPAEDPSIYLREGTSYDYRLESKRYVLGESALIHPNRMEGEQHRGRIDTGIYVGLLTLQLLDAESGKCMADVAVEIRSRKLSYERDYRYMLEDIATRCAELLMELRAPVTQYFSPADTEEAQTLVQRLAFLKALIGSEDFQNALHRIITMPNTIWKEEVRNIPVGQSRRLGHREVRQLAKGSRRMNVPSGHPLLEQDILEYKLLHMFWVAGKTI